MPTLVITLTSASTTTVTQTFDATDAQRYFNAWKNKAGPIDPVTGQPNGTQQQMTAYISQRVIDNLNGLITLNEYTPVTPPATTPS